MSNVVISAAELEDFHPPAGVSSVEMRVFLSKPVVFTGEDAPGQIVSPFWYRSFTCTVAGNVLNIPEITLQSTTDAEPNDGKYRATFHGLGNTVFGGFESFRLPPTTPTTWADIFAFNNDDLPLSLPVIDLNGRTIEGGTFEDPTITSPTVTGGTFSSPTLTGTPLIRGYPLTLEVNAAATPSTGAGPDTLHSFNLLAGSLANDLDYVEVEYGFIFASNDNNKAIRATFGGTEYINRGIGAQDIDGTLGGVIRATIVRLSATSVHVSATMTLNLMYADSANAFTGTSANGGMVAASNLVISGLPDLTANDTPMAGQSLGVAAGDVSQRLSVIKLVQR